MSAVVVRERHADDRRPRLIYSAPAWKDDLDRSVSFRRTVQLRVAGNVVFLPAPVAGYRLRHVAGAAHIEVVSCRGHVSHIGRCDTVQAARDLLQHLWNDHSRPVLAEVGDAA